MKAAADSLRALLRLDPDPPAATIWSYVVYLPAMLRLDPDPPAATIQELNILKGT